MENYQKLTTMRRLITFLMLILMSAYSFSAEIVGSMGGAFSVNEMGAATYTIPIEVPQGLNGLKPNLAITYNSQAGNGVCGMGMSLTGLSVITRVPRSIYYDKTAQGIKYNQTDAYALNGQRLICTSGKYGENKAVYQLENDLQTTITQYGTGRNQWFEVKSNGITTKIGSKGENRLVINNVVVAWYVDYASDLYNNYMTYVYMIDNNCMYIDTIKYGTNKRIDNTAENVIKFKYAGRSDVTPFFINGVAGKMGKRLASITAIPMNSKSAYRTYTLTYTNTADNDKISRLISVTVKGAGSQTLRPITFDWNTVPSVMSSTRYISNAASVPITDQQMTSGDITGDGRSELIMVSNENSENQSYYIYGYNTSGTFSLLHKETLKNGYELDSGVVRQKEPYGFNVADLDGDGKNDIMIPIIGKTNKAKNYTHFCAAVLSVKSVLKIKYYTNSALIKQTKSAPLYTLADFYNCGVSSILYLETDDNSGVYSAALTSPKSTKFDLKMKFKLPSKPLRILTSDFNCDGLQDLLVMYSGGYTIYWNQGLSSKKAPYAEDNNGESIKKLVSNKSLIYDGQDIVNLGDFNGDGLIDILSKRKDSNAIYIAFSKGNGEFDRKCVSSELDVSDRSYTERDDNRINIEVVDFNNDGCSDAIITFSQYKDGSKWFEKPWGKFVKTYTYWLKSDGTKLIVFKTASSNKADDGLSNCYTSGDFDGDGHVELVNYGYNCLSSNEANTTPALNMYYLSNGERLNKVSCVTSDFGRRTYITYSTLANTACYAKGSGSKFPLVDITLPVTVVSSTSENNGATPSNVNISYSYKGLRAHMQGKGLIGFKTIVSENQTTSEIREQTINLLDTVYYVPAQITQTTKVGNYKKTTVTTFTVKGKGGMRYFSFPSTIIDKDIFGQEITTTNKFNNTYGYQTSQRTDYAENMYKAISYNKFINIGGQWLPQEITTQQRHSDANGTFSSNTKRKYNSACDIVYEIADSASAREVITRYSYDKVGNVTAISVTGKEAVSPPATKYIYDDTYRFVVAKESGYQKYNYEYDVFGNLTTESDNSDAENPLKTTYRYDNFGVLTNKSDPMGVATKITTDFESPTGDVYWIKTEETNAPWVKVRYDQCGREVYRETVGELGVNISVATTYDKCGNVSSVTSNYGNGNIVKTKKYQYDILGRVTSINQDFKQPTGGTKTTTFSYAKNKVTTVENGKTYTKITDIMGFTKKITDQLSDITYTYASCGEPATISTGGATYTITYDRFGRRTSFADPDAGKTSYTYDALDRVLTQKSARGITTTNTYNKYGNLTKSECGDFVTTYTYDALQNLIEEKTNGGNSITYTRDKFGRITRKIQNIGDKKLQFDYGYSRNLLVTKVFPENTRQQFKYDQYGYNNCVTVLNDTIWLLTKNNGLERIAKSGKSLSLRKTYTPNGFISNNSISTDNKTLHNMIYLFNEHKGELNIRTGMRINGNTEYFSYDKHDRLTSWTDNGGSKQSFSYAANGNLLTKDFRRLTYDTKRVHAVVEKTDTRRQSQYKREECTGDPNPFINSLVDSEFKDQTITYTPFDKVETIMQCVDALSFGLERGNAAGRTAKYKDKNGTEKSYSIPKKAFDAEYVPLVLTYTYGPDRQRCKLEEWAASNAGSLYQVFTKYYGDGYEEVTDKKLGMTFKYYYIDTPDGLTALVVRAKGNNVNSVTKYIVQTDYLGSIVAIYNQDGGIKYRAEYDAWGQQTLSQNDFLYFTRGFTGHEHLREFELINMNGRFLSPDPFIQAPENSQNYNAYSYCLNNPLKYTDPSGEFWHIVIGAAIGGVVNLIANWDECDGFWQGAAAFGIGAGAGALTAATGGAGASIWAVGGVSAAGGAATMATNDVISQTGKNFSGIGDVNWGSVGCSAAIGGVSGFAGGAAGSFAGTHIGGIVINGVNITSPVAKGVIVGSIGGTAGGAVGGYVGGYMATGSSKGAKEAALRGMWQGASIGGVAGGIGAYTSAKSAGINPWSGKTQTRPIPIKYDFTPDPYGDNVTLYRGTTGSEGDGGPLFMTDNPEYAATYVKNGGSVTKVTIPRYTLKQMQGSFDVIIRNGLHGTSYGVEYEFHPSVMPDILQLFN